MNEEEIVFVNDSWVKDIRKVFPTFGEDEVKITYGDVKGILIRLKEILRVADCYLGEPRLMREERVKEKCMNCLFFHKWSKWSKPTAGYRIGHNRTLHFHKELVDRGLPGDTGVVPTTIQQRTCSECGKNQRREV